MNMNQPSPDTGLGVRKAYIKPQVEKISLLVKESVLSTGCKATNLNGPYRPNTTPVTCNTNSCIDMGT